jgi:N-acetyl-gamma-glutamyl-phosphate reductase
VPYEQRHDLKARKEALNSADIAFLCLPDEGSIEAMTLIESGTAVIDTSTAHRTAPGWEYGFAELAGRRERIA